MIDRQQSNYIKVIAMIAMLIDHISAYLWPVQIMRIIGRIAFPIFAYQIGIGYQSTSSKKNYIKRMLIFAFISQIPYHLLNNDFQLNILFLFVIGIWTISLIEKKSYHFLAFPIALSSIVSFGFYGLVVILIFYFLRDKINQAVSFFSANLAYILNVESMQIFSLLALPIIFNPLGRLNIPRNLFYFFYPSHLLLIYLIRLIAL